jgi:hypothetical protein
MDLPAGVRRYYALFPAAVDSLLAEQERMERLLRRRK